MHLLSSQLSKISLTKPNVRDFRSARYTHPRLLPFIAERNVMASPDPLSGKKVVILGLARQGTALAEFLAKVGARVTISDMRTADRLAEPLRELDGLPNLTTVLGEHPASMLDGASLLCLSGGVPLDAPIVQEA